VSDNRTYRGPDVGVVWGDRNGFPCTCTWSGAYHGNRCPEHGVVGVPIPTHEEVVAEKDAEIVGLREKVAKLQAFKDWVHKYLDDHGAPHHPPGPHGAEGCRIGDRMDWLMARIGT
jgi:hypothetical protein